MKNDTSSPNRLTSAEVQNLADFVLFSQRSCILNLSPVLTRGKVSYPQFFLLAYLAEEDCLSMSNIARMMGHSTAAATGMVDKLQTLGHLKRYTAAADRRKIMVRITERGRELVAQMRNNIAQELSQLMAQDDRAEKMDAAHRVISRRAAKAQD
ncbi:MAG: MarR family transcriptional regulator [Akkermansia sp.]|nr:MarR family transcriptional regulator [Akkermansia sp.]